MTRLLTSIEAILDAFDVAVLDQWGVLHDGAKPYPHAVDAMNLIAGAGKEIIVVSNSGKRSDLNRKRISKIGLPVDHVSKVVTSGEALWEDLHSQRIQIAGKTPRVLFPICGQRQDPHVWVGESQFIKICPQLDETVDAIMLMGLADGTKEDAFDETFKRTLDHQLPLICSNPDKTSPRSDGLVTSPGALADRFAEMGGTVVWYGKPHANIYGAVLRHCPDVQPVRFLMVGDSLEHDIGGAQQMGFTSALIRGGIHRGEFETCRNDSERNSVLEKLVRQNGVKEPNFCLPLLA